MAKKIYWQKHNSTIFFTNKEHIVSVINLIQCEAHHEILLDSLIKK